jgi:microsomal dipeptidase-like Zn-dependent dipeptidase
MRFFDFHCHILLKQLFAEHPNIDSRMSSSDVTWIPKNCTDLPNILQSQIHQSQLADFTDEVVVGVALYGLESYLSQQVIPLRQYLRSSVQDKMWLPLFEAIANNNAVPSYKTFDDFTWERTLSYYLKASTSYHILTKDSFTSPLLKNKVNLFFVIEGCHSLVNSTLDAPLNHPTRKFQPDEILQNLDKVLKEVPVLSINLTHMQQSNLCNHAFGMQLAGNEPFYPRGNGLTNDGRKVVQGLFDRGVAVDVKHMSILSRRMLYQEIDEGRFKNRQHVHCTHAGFTGIPFKNWPGYIHHLLEVGDVYYLEIAKTMHTKNGTQLPGAPAFNSSTINLFDEEIVWIVKNGGMIGLSMDRRIIGYVDPHDNDPVGRKADSLHYVDKEYFSKAEWASLNLGKKAGYLIEEGDCLTEIEVQDNLGMSMQARNEYFYDHVLLQLKHFLQVCYEAGIDLKEAQKHITIGSDYDGMINPFLNMATVQDMPALKNYITANFGFYLASLRDTKKWRKTLDIPAFAEGLFYENGYQYIRNFFVKPA